MSDILTVYDSPTFDDSVCGEEYRWYIPRIQSFDNSDETRIPISNQESYTYPHNSYIYIRGKIEDMEGTGEVKLINNTYIFLFDEIKYELNGNEIDRCLKPDYATTIKIINCKWNQENENY